MTDLTHTLSTAPDYAEIENGVRQAACRGCETVSVFVASAWNRVFQLLSIAVDGDGLH